MTLRAGIVGWPVKHSRSPALHGYWLRQHGIDGTYERFPVEPHALPDFVARARGELAGFNATLPHKIALLDLVDEADATARRIGAANTVTVRDGRLLASNTDAFGFRESLREAAPALDLRLGPALVLGAGGAARAIVVALLEAGAPEVRLHNRNRGRAEALAAAIGGPVKVLPKPDLSGLALLVNATSLGMAGQPPLDLDLGRLPQAAVVADIVYVPLQTGLLEAARARGNPTVDGLGMLLHQARPSFQAWFGVAPEVTPALRRAVLEAPA